MLKSAEADAPRQVQSLTAEVNVYKQKVKQMMQQRTTDERQAHGVNERLTKALAENQKLQSMIQASNEIKDTAQLKQSLEAAQQKLQETISADAVLLSPST